MHERSGRPGGPGPGGFARVRTRPDPVRGDRRRSPRQPRRSADVGTIPRRVYASAGDRRRTWLDRPGRPARWHAAGFGRRRQDLASAQAAAFDGGEIILLALSPAYAQDRTLFVATTSPSAEVVLWRSVDGGARWDRWLVERDARAAGGQRFMALGVSPNYANDELVFAGLGPRVFKTAAACARGARGTAAPGLAQRRPGRGRRRRDRRSGIADLRRRQTLFSPPRMPACSSRATLATPTSPGAKAWSRQPWSPWRFLPRIVTIA